MAFLDNSKTQRIADGLEYPEGPIYCSDGSILLVEIKGQRLTRVGPRGTIEKLADIPGGPNGAAVGPKIGTSPQVYICNDGGFDWQGIPPGDADPWLWIPTTQPADYIGGRLQRVNLDSGEVTDLFTETMTMADWPPTPQGLVWNPPFTLKGLDDLVFDKDGGLWISDFGKQRTTSKDVTGIYYVSPDGKTMRQAVYPLNSPNGIGLSPCGEWLYVALSYERRVLKYQVGEGGTIIPNKKTLDGSYLVTGDFIGCSVLDSMAVDEAGNLYVATMVPQGNDPTINGGITVITPDGKHSEFIEIVIPPTDADPTPKPCPLPSNICFGGDDGKTAFITCGGTGHLISMPSEHAGLALKYSI